MDAEAPPPPQPEEAAPAAPAPAAAAPVAPPSAGTYVQQPRVPPVGGVGTALGGVPVHRRVSNATESTPLFLGDEDGEGHNKPLIFDESGERDYGPGRWKATGEAIVAKIFWDGFFWERFAFISAKGLGYGSTSMPYFLLTGVGASLGVFLGQLAYASAVYGVSVLQHRHAGQRVPTPKTLLMGLEFAALIATAAFFTGFFWQPVANLMMALAAPVSASPNVLFAVVVTGLWVIETVVFFVALHTARYAFSALLRFEAVEAALQHSTLIYDATLALSVGGATGFFFATNGSYAANALTRAFGVMPWTGPWTASFYGGASSATGFLFAQALQNALFPVNTSWADSRKKGHQQLKYTEEEILLPYRAPYG